MGVSPLPCMTSIARRLRKFPLRLVLILPFVLQVSTAVGLTGWLSLRNGQKAVDDLAVQLENEIIERIEQHLETYLNLPYQVIQSQVEANRLGLLNVNDPEQLSRTFWKEIQLNPAISYLSFAKEKDGGFVDAGRQQSGRMVIEQTENYVAGDFYIYSTDDQGNRTAVLSIAPDYDPRQRPWYTIVRGKTEPMWSDIYSLFPDQVLAIAASVPLYDDEETFLGVFGADITLAQLSSFLQSLRIGQSGQAVIVERSGEVVALSTSDLPFQVTQPGIEQKRLTLAEVDSPMLQAATAHLQATFGHLQDIQSIEQMEFLMEGDRHYLQVAPFQDVRGLDWLILVVVPESDFMAQIRANTRQTIALSLGALGVAIALGIYTSRWISQPIEALSRASEAIATGNLEHTVAPQRVREMDTLAQNFNDMTRTLNGLVLQLEAANTELENRVERRTTELKDAMNQLKMAQLRLVQTEKMSSLGQLVAGIAHEINNPVNFIHGNLTHASEYTQGLLTLLDLYEQTYPAGTSDLHRTQQKIDLEFIREDFPRLITSMRLGATRIREIVASLRNFSRLDETELKRIDFHAELDDTLLALQTRLNSFYQEHHREIEIVRNYGDLPLVECYPSHFHQVFLNLLANAIDALEDRLILGLDETASADPQITITTQRLDSQWILIQIRDNGVGILEKFQAKLFDPFFTTKPVGKGTGLGLFICYRIIVDQYKGELNFTSILGQGTEFSIKVPSQMNFGLSDSPHEGLSENQV